MVEDERGSRTALGYVLTHAGHDVALAATVAEAMGELAASPPPDFVILDLMLPDGPGDTVLRAVRSSARPDTAVAVVTGVNDLQWLARVEALRPTVVMQKPIRVDELLRMI